MIATTLRNEYSSTDYQLAEMDGRLTTLPPKEERKKSYKAKGPKKLDISTLVDKMNDKQREELLQQLLK